MTTPGQGSSDADATALGDILTAVAQGDQQAFSEFYDRTSSHLFSVIIKVLRNQALAEEVLQDVCVQIWQNAGSFDPQRGKALTWALTMAHRRAVDRVRSVRASQERDLRQGVKEFRESYDDVEDTVTTRIESERVETAMEDLNTGQITTIKLAYYGGYTQQEVARIMDVPIGTVKTRMRDGMNKLRKTLGVST